MAPKTESTTSNITGTVLNPGETLLLSTICGMMGEVPDVDYNKVAELVEIKHGRNARAKAKILFAKIRAANPAIMAAVDAAADNEEDGNAALNSIENSRMPLPSHAPTKKVISKPAASKKAVGKVAAPKKTVGKVTAPKKAVPATKKQPVNKASAGNGVGKADPKTTAKSVPIKAEPGSEGEEMHDADADVEDCLERNDDEIVYDDETIDEELEKDDGVSPVPVPSPAPPSTPAPTNQAVLASTLVALALVLAESTSAAPLQITSVALTALA
ncbi:hypothetical protein JHW43_000721 [Diplocarpon mali]|nr:hypothetical protein JHW43_000721 [Diplocarpon mali]